MDKLVRRCLILLLVVLPPIATFFMLVSPLIQIAQAKSWESAKAELREVTGSNLTRDQKIQTSVAYTFSYNSQQYTGTKIDFWPRLNHDQIDERLKGKESVEVWFDPSQPEQAVIYRDVDWKAVAVSCVPAFISLYSISL